MTKCDTIYGSDRHNVLQSSGCWIPSARLMKRDQGASRSTLDESRMRARRGLRGVGDADKQWSGTGRQMLAATVLSSRLLLTMKSVLWFSLFYHALAHGGHGPAEGESMKQYADRHVRSTPFREYIQLTVKYADGLGTSYASSFRCRTQDGRLHSAERRLT